MIEVDRDTEQQIDFREKIAKLYAFGTSETYERLYQARSFNVAFFIQAPKRNPVDRLTEVLLWTERELRQRHLEHDAVSFSFCALDPATTDSRGAPAGRRLVPPVQHHAPCPDRPVRDRKEGYDVAASRRQSIPLGTYGSALFRRRLRLDGQDAKSHMHVMGKSGSGKSRWLAGFYVNLLKAGFSATLIDPHGDLARLVLAQLVADGYFDQEDAYERLLYLDIPPRRKSQPLPQLQLPQAAV